MSRRGAGDLAFAAAAASGQEPDLPSVDDLEVAALAAAAGMEYYQESDDSSSSDSDSSDYDDNPGDIMNTTGPNEGVQGSADRVEVQFQITGDHVGVHLHHLYSLQSRHPSDVQINSSGESEMDDDDSSSSSSEDDDEDMITDYNQIRKLINDMDEDEGPVDYGATAANELFGDAPLPALSNIVITPEDTLTPAGNIISALEGMIVVRASTGSRPLDEGTVLLLEDKTILGVVEEIFGPVNAPLYAMRQSDPNAAPPATDALVYSVERLSAYLLPEQLRIKGYDADGVEEADDAELQFSDDEAEAQYKRQQQAKRKGVPPPAVGDSPAQKQPQKTARGRGRGRGRGGPPPQQYQQQQQQQYGGFRLAQPTDFRPAVAPYPGPPPPGNPQRVFSGRGQGPSPALQTYATAGQLSGMSLATSPPSNGQQQ